MVAQVSQLASLCQTLLTRRFDHTLRILHLQAKKERAKRTEATSKSGSSQGSASMTTTSCLPLRWPCRPACVRWHMLNVAVSKHTRENILAAAA